MVVTKKYVTTALSRNLFVKGAKVCYTELNIIHAAVMVGSDKPAIPG